MSRRGLPPELKNQLGSFFRTTLQQLDTVREVVTQASKEGKRQLDLTLLKRKRQALLTEIGETVVRLAREGKLDEGDFPELSGLFSRLDALEEQLEASSANPRPAGWGGHKADDAEPHEEDLEEYAEEAADLPDLEPGPKKK
ncbi:MAG: hypothetical protein HY698_18920 [Deltaproteobacteria bacterium]|nr:hypothetical protein [Deltaproteobacteria bacterium]